MQAAVAGGVQAALPGLVGALAPAEFDAVTVVRERSYRDHRRQCGDSANMVAMEVRGDKVVQLLPADLFLEDPEDSSRVTIVESRPAGIQEHGLEVGSDDKRRGPAFHVDPIDLQEVAREQRARRERETGRLAGRGSASERGRVRPGRTQRRHEHRPRSFRDAGSAGPRGVGIGPQTATRPSPAIR